MFFDKLLKIREEHIIEENIVELIDITMFDDIIFEHPAEMVGKDCQVLIEKLENDGFNVILFYQDICWRFI